MRARQGETINLFLLRYASGPQHRQCQILRHLGQGRRRLSGAYRSTGDRDRRPEVALCPWPHCEFCETDIEGDPGSTWCTPGVDSRSVGDRDGVRAEAAARGAVRPVCGEFIVLMGTFGYRVHAPWGEAAEALVMSDIRSGIHSHFRNRIGMTDMSIF